MNFLVPYDFTPIAFTAFEYALQIRKKVEGKIELLHIISNESERQDAESKFAAVLASLTADQSRDVITKISVGDIYTDISKEAEDGEYQMMVMGTHGAKGLQKIFGSRAIKVITSSKTPFIITQEKGPLEQIKLIVIPVDLSKESIQIVRFVTDVAKRFDSEVHLLCAPESDEWLVKKLRTNISQASSVLSKAGVKHEIKELPGKDSFDQEVIDYGAIHRCDLFAVAHFSESILPQFERFSQHLITNKLQVPVLIVNASQIENIDTNYSFITV
jgi:nucleotide-binding universal stress UspA family protein